MKYVILEKGRGPDKKPRKRRGTARSIRDYQESEATKNLISQIANWKRKSEAV